MQSLGVPIVSFEEFDANRPSGRIVMTSGGFDPIHPGHISSIQESGTYGDVVVVVVNGDAFLEAKKGKAFQDMATRCAIVSAISGVDYVIPFEIDDDPTVCQALRRVRPDVFTKGGDRVDHTSIPEWEVCQELGIEIISGVGADKAWSSSWFLDDWTRHVLRSRADGGALVEIRGTALLGDVLRQAHVYLESRLDLCRDPEVLYARLPGSDLQSIGAIYAHALVTEDHSFARWRVAGPLYQQEEWSSLGLPPEVWLDPEWASGFAPPPASLRSYAAAVYASTDEVLASLADPELTESRRLQLPEYRGSEIVIEERQASVLFALLDNVVLHMSEHAGEIAALLGVQGLKANPW